MADAVQKDKVGLAQEFEDAAPAQDQAAQAQSEEFVREYDLGDGSGKQVFRAKSYEELADKIAEAHQNAARQLLKVQKDYKELSRGRQPEPKSSDWQEIKPGQHTQDEIAQLEAHPHQLFRRMFQAETGLSPEEFRQRENENRRYQAELRAQDEFVRKHPDYNPVPDNAEKIMRFLAQQNLPVSRRNLDYAYDELQGELTRRPANPAPAGDATKRAEPDSQPATQVRTTSTPPSFIRPSLGGPVEREGGGQDAEIARIAQSGSLPEMKARIEQYFRQQRSSAR